MKKTLCYLLAAMMWFTFSACSTQSQKDSVFSDLPEEVGFIVHVSINPEFELLEDYGEYILELRCLNEDAEQAFAHTDVAGMSNQKGIRELLSVVENGGYLTNGSTIEITCYANNGIPDKGEGLYNEIDKALTEYQKKIDFTYSLSLADRYGNAVSTPNHEFADNQDNEADTLDESSYLEVEKDADGNVIKTVSVDEQHRTVTSYYNAAGTVIREIIESEGAASDYTYNDDQVLIKLEEHTADGYSAVKEFNRNGILIRQEEHASDGSYNIQEYHENGDISYLIDTLTGEYCHLEFRYNAKGQLLQVIEMNESGTVVSIEMYAYDENGAEISLRSYDATSCSYEDSYDEIEFDANGCISKLIYREDDIGYTETILFTDGFYSAHQWTDSDEGSENGWGYSNYDIYGNLTEIGWYDPAMRSFGSRIYNADGSYTYYGYYISSDGSRHEVNAE